MLNFDNTIVSLFLRSSSEQLCDRGTMFIRMLFSTKKLSETPVPFYNCFVLHTCGFVPCREAYKPQARMFETNPRNGPSVADLAHNHALHAGKVALFGCNLEVSIYDSIYELVHISACQVHDKTYVTARRVPVPEPRAPIRSLATERAPMQAPPKAAAVGMMRLSSLYMLWSR